MVPKALCALQERSTSTHIPYQCGDGSSSDDPKGDIDADHHSSRLHKPKDLKGNDECHEANCAGYNVDPSQNVANSISEREIRGAHCWGLEIEVERIEANRWTPGESGLGRRSSDVQKRRRRHCKDRHDLTDYARQEGVSDGLDVLDRPTQGQIEWESDGYEPDRYECPKPMIQVTMLNASCSSLPVDRVIVDGSRHRKSIGKYGIRI